jgi:hypothetical protein
VPARTLQPSVAHANCQPRLVPTLILHFLAMPLPLLAATVCNLTGLWFGDSPAPITVDLGTPPSWFASLGGVWTNEPGTYTPADGSLTFSCCGGISGSIDASCSTITWSDAHHDVWRRASSSSASISTPFFTVGLGVEGQAATLNSFSFFGAGANTTNFALAGGATQNGGTMLVPAGLAGTGGGAVSASCGAGCSVSSTPTRASLTNATLSIDGAVVAVESWALSLVNASAFSFTVDRVWTGAGPALAVDRFAFSFRTTGGLPIHSEQIPGFVDLALFYNQTSAGGFDIGNSEFEFLSPASSELVRFTPTGALFRIDGTATVGGEASPVLFSFAKPFADGTAWCSIGFETIDPRAGARQALTAGTAQRLTVTFHLIETDVPTKGPGAGSFPALSVSLPNATLNTQMNVLFNTQYQLMGWIMGNNPASVPCLHEMAWWPLMASTLDAGSVAFAAMQLELSFFAGCGWSPEAADKGQYQFVHSCNLAEGALFGLTHRFASSGFYNALWGPFMDENVMFPVAVYYTATSSGDLTWLQSLRPALDAMMKFFAAHGLNASAPRVVFVSPASGIADGNKHASNWYDVINFGHLDAYIAVHAVWALGCLAEIYAALGDSAAAADAAALHARATADFNAIFWNETSGSYTDWIDANGNARHYFYVDIAFVAVLSGVANASQAGALFAHYDARLARIYTDYNVTPGSIWSAPSNLYPITDACEFANAGGGQCPRAFDSFPSYENGGSFFHTPGLQFAALGAGGRANDAYDGFVALMNSGFGQIRGWAQQLFWGTNGRPDSLVGGDPLNTAVLPIWGFLRSAFGVAHTLTRGLVVVSSPAKAAIGAVWNTSHLGASVCLTVQDNPLRTTFCNGSVVGRRPGNGEGKGNNAGT